MTVKPLPIQILLTGLAAALALLFAVLLVLAQLARPGDSAFTAPLAPESRSLMAWNWFALAQVPPGEQAAVASTEEYDEVSIQAVLLGVIIAPGAATATIRIAREEKVFAPGDEIQPGIEVSRIEPTRVVVNQRGRTLQLSFPEQAGAVRVSPARGNAGSGAASGKAFSIPDLFAAEPVSLAGYDSAYRLGSLSPELSQRAGIQEGDVVVRVGKLSISEIQANPASWLSLSTDTALPVTVVRDGSQLTLYVNALALSARLLPDLGLNQQD